MEEKILIENYKAKRLELDEAEDAMNNHFEGVVDDMLLNKTDFTMIKERLRIMPESASKVLLFRKILLAEKNV